MACNQVGMEAKGRLRGRKQKGSALLEGALVLTVFIYGFLGIIDLSVFMHTQQSLVERTRSAVRTAVVTGATDDQIRNLIMYSQSTSPGASTKGAYGLTATNIQISRYDQGTNDQRLEVRITGLQLPTVTPLLSRFFQNAPVKVVYSTEAVS